MQRIPALAASITTAARLQDRPLDADTVLASEMEAAAASSDEDESARGDSSDFEVEAIIGHSIITKPGEPPEISFKISWRGLNSESDSWEDRCNLSGADDILGVYENTHLDIAEAIASEYRSPPPAMPPAPPPPPPAPPAISTATRSGRRSATPRAWWASDAAAAGSAT